MAVGILAQFVKRRPREMSRGPFVARTVGWQRRALRRRAHLERPKLRKAGRLRFAHPTDRPVRGSKPAELGHSFFSVARLSAVPRISPSVAPESEEPYWAIASFSSATSSALMETVTLWA